MYPESIFYAPQKPLAGIPGIFVISGNKPLCINDLLDNVYDFGTDPPPIIIPPKSAIIPLPALINPAQAKLQAIINAMAPGNGFRTTQQIFGIIQHDKPPKVIVDQIMAQWVLKERDQRRIRELWSNLRKLGLGY
jgi:hypothetical protein